MSSRFRLTVMVLFVLIAALIAVIATFAFVLPSHKDPYIDNIEAAAENGQFVGMTPQQISAWLGTEPSDYIRSGWDVAYRLGDERGFISIDSEWLVLRLDYTGRVAEAQVVSD